MPTRSIHTLSLAVLTALALTMPADAARLASGTSIRDDDVARMGRLNDSLGRGLRQALAGGSEADIAALLRAMQGTAKKVDAATLTGTWRCRTIKLGKTLPLVVYGEFNCRITQEDGVLSLNKTTGSQRTRGVIANDAGGPTGAALVYRGVGYIAGDTPPAYDDLPEAIDTGATPQVVPEVGAVEVISRSHMRIIMPKPWLESDLNVIELRR